MLGLPRQTKSWYRDRLKEESRERRLASTRCHKLSETADVFYIISRAQHDNYPLRQLPRFSHGHLLVYAYLIPKYTLRWLFYRLASRLCGHADPLSVREVVNPAKSSKLHQVASRHGISPIEFRQVCLRLRFVWPLLP